MCGVPPECGLWQEPEPELEAENDDAGTSQQLIVENPGSKELSTFWVNPDNGQEAHTARIQL